MGGKITLVLLGREYPLPDLLICAILACDLAGFLLGAYYYYGPELSRTSLLLWPFVPDCPLAAGFIFLATCLLWLGRKNDIANMFAISAGLAYGLWTMGVLMAYPDFYNGYNGVFLSAALWLLHLFMVLQALMLIRETRFTPVGISAAMAFLFASWVSDYGLGTSPPIPLYAFAEIASATFLLAAGVFIAIFLLKESRILDDLLSFKAARDSGKT